jgi:hypothetical protein
VAAGTPLVVSIRPHEIELVSAGHGAPPGPGANTFSGTVLRTNYLGDAVDSQVRLTKAMSSCA